MVEKDVEGVLTGNSPMPVQGLLLPRCVCGGAHARGDLKFSWTSNTNLRKEHCPPHSWDINMAAQLPSFFFTSRRPVLCCS